MQPLCLPSAGGHSPAGARVDNMRVSLALVFHILPGIPRRRDSPPPPAMHDECHALQAPSARSLAHTLSRCRPNPVSCLIPAAAPCDLPRLAPSFRSPPVAAPPATPAPWGTYCLASRVAIAAHRDPPSRQTPLLSGATVPALSLNTGWPYQQTFAQPPVMRKHPCGHARKGDIRDWNDPLPVLLATAKQSGTAGAARPLSHSNTVPGSGTTFS
jgi:hypothetical protein